MKQTIPPSLNPLFAIVEQWFTVTLNEFSEQLSEHLSDKAEKSNVTTVQSDCFTALHSINKFSNEAIGVFLDSLAQNFQLVSSEHQPSSSLLQQSRANQLNLLETKVLEENLSFDTAVGKITNNNREAFEHLDIRITALLKSKAEHISKKPLSGENIISAFRDSMELFDFSPSLRLEVYRLFEQYISRKISKLLQKLNNVLISEGFMPEILTDYAIKKENREKQQTKSILAESSVPDEQDFSPSEPTVISGNPQRPPSAGFNLPVNRPIAPPMSNNGMNTGNFPPPARNYSQGAVEQNMGNNNFTNQKTNVPNITGTPSRQPGGSINNRYLDLANQLSKNKNTPQGETGFSPSTVPVNRAAAENVQDEKYSANSINSNNQLNKLLGHSNHPSNNSRVNYFSSLKQIYADKHQEQSNLGTSIFIHEHETSTEEILEALSNVQSKSSLRESGQDASLPSVHKQIKHNILAGTDKSPESTQLKNNKLYLIDMIEDLFNHISDNKKLSVSARNLFQNLTIPLIHLTLVDETFIDNSNHVARLFLDDFADAAMGITDSEGNSNTPIFLKLKKITTQLAQKNKVNSSVFSDLHQDLKRFINHRKQFANTKSQSSRASMIKKIDAILKHCTNGKELPAGITLILNKIWKNVMLNLYLDNTCNDEQREKATAFINSLLFSIKPVQSAHEKKRLRILIPIIDNELQFGLTRINCPALVTDKVTAYLKKLHHNALNAFSKASDKRLSATNDEVIIYRNELFDDSKNTDYRKKPIEDETISDDLILFDQSINKKTVAKEIVSLEEAITGESVSSGSETATLSVHGVDKTAQTISPSKRLSKTDFELIRLVGHSYKMKLIEDNYTRIAKNIVEDAWLEFHFKTRFSRVKITWIEDDHSQFNCLTQNNRVIEISLEALSDSFRQGICTVIQSSSIIDEAIKAISDDASQKPT